MFSVQQVLFSTVPEVTPQNLSPKHVQLYGSGTMPQLLSRCEFEMAPSAGLGGNTHFSVLFVSPRVSNPRGPAVL